MVARQLGDDVLRDAVAEVLLLRVATHIGEGKYGDRGAIPQRPDGLADRGAVGGALPDLWWDALRVGALWGGSGGAHRSWRGPAGANVTIQMFGFRFRRHAQLPMEALAAEFVLAKRSILPPLTDVELHDRAMRPLLKRVKR